MDIPIRSHMSMLTDDQVARIRARWEREKRVRAEKQAAPAPTARAPPRRCRAGAGPRAGRRCAERSPGSPPSQGRRRPSSRRGTRRRRGGCGRTRPRSVAAEQEAIAAEAARLEAVRMEALRAEEAARAQAEAAAEALAGRARRTRTQSTPELARRQPGERRRSAHLPRRTRIPATPERPRPRPVTPGAPRPRPVASSGGFPPRPIASAAPGGGGPGMARVATTSVRPVAGRRSGAGRRRRRQRRWRWRSQCRRSWRPAQEGQARRGRSGSGGCEHLENDGHDAWRAVAS